MKSCRLGIITALAAAVAWGAQVPAPQPGPAPQAGTAPAPGGDVLRLTHRDALRLGSTNLLQARVAREIREQYRQLPEAERGFFDWTVSASATNSRSEFGLYDLRASGLASLYLTDANTQLDSRSASMGLSKFNALGGTLNLTLSSAYNAGATQWASQTFPNGPAGVLAWDSLNPYSGHASLSYTQPLLRGFGPNAAEAKLRAAMEEAKAADETFRQRMNDLLTKVDHLYWNQVFASQNLENKKIALELARKQLQEDQDRVKAGMLAPIELPQTEAAVADRERAVIAAEGLLDNARQALLEELFPEGGRPSTIEPVDSPEPGPRPRPHDDALATALARRPEVAEAEHSLSATRTLEKAAKNAVLPQLDTQVAVLRDTTSHTDASGVWNDWTQSRYPGYYVGLSFSYPIGNRTRRARLSQARAATRGAEYSLKDARTSVALDLEQTYTTLVTARKQVEAADKALAFRQESLDAEMSKLENGMSTSFFVLQRQTELDQARTTDLEARIAAEKARTELQRAMGILMDNVEGADAKN